MLNEKEARSLVRRGEENEAARRSDSGKVEVNTNWMAWISVS